MENAIICIKILHVGTYRVHGVHFTSSVESLLETLNRTADVINNEIFWSAVVMEKHPVVSYVLC